MRKNKNVLVIYKVVFGLLGLSALVTEVATLIGRGRFVPVNFLSFFTVESNLFAAIILLVSAGVVMRGKAIRHLDMLRGAATLYMVTTGIVFSVLLSGLDPSLLTAVPWDNIVLHYIMPIVLLVDWLIDPPRRRIMFGRALLVWLVYPLTYVMYSLIRGHHTGWYPYPFLSPAKHGYAGVAIISLGITLTVVALTWTLLKLGNTRSNVVEPRLR